MDIVIYTKASTLNHKRGLARGEGPGLFYWEFGRAPKKIESGDRVYFAVDGFVAGSFEIMYIEQEGHVIEWHSTSWEELKEKIQIDSFRGFRYRWWEFQI